jgi:putative tricarboxylic transport membrane protein
MQNNTILSKTEYHSVNSFTHLGNIALDPVAIVVKPDGPYKTLNDLIEAAKKKPGKVSIGATGKGSVDYLTSLSMERASGVQYAIVNLEGIEGFTAVMGGNMDAMPATISAILQYYKAGQLKVLAVATDKRVPEMPDVPTFKESNVQLLASGVYRSLIAPKGLSQDVKAALAKALKQAIDDPAFKERATKIALPIYYLPPQETEKVTKDLLDAGEKVLK